MRLRFALATTALLSTGCGLDFDKFAGDADGSASDAAAGMDSSQPGQDSGGGGDSGGLDASGPDTSSTDGPGGTDGPACSMATCGSACVASCASCKGGTDFVTCLVCADGGPPVQVCGPADSNGFCLNGNYGHCSCQQDSDCPAANQRCTNNQCAACGEPIFNQNHTRCSGGGNCCKTGASLGKCSC